MYYSVITINANFVDKYKCDNANWEQKILLPQPDESFHGINFYCGRCSNMKLEVVK